MCIFGSVFKNNSDRKFVWGFTSTKQGEYPNAALNELKAAPTPTPNELKAAPTPTPNEPRDLNSPCCRRQGKHHRARSISLRPRRRKFGAHEQSSGNSTFQRRHSSAVINTVSMGGGAPCTSPSARHERRRRLRRLLDTGQLPSPPRDKEI